MINVIFYEVFIINNYFGFEFFHPLSAVIYDYFSYSILLYKLSIYKSDFLILIADAINDNGYFNSFNFLLVIIIKNDFEVVTKFDNGNIKIIHPSIVIELYIAI